MCDVNDTEEMVEVLEDDEEAESEPERNSYNAELSQDDKVLVDNLVEQGKVHIRRAAEDIVDFGKVLIQLKEILPHGSYERCIEKEFGLSASHANNFVNVAKRFADKPQFILGLKPTVLFSLAAPTTPYEAIDKVFLKVEAGETVDVEVVKQMIRGLKPVHYTHLERQGRRPHLGR